MSSRAELQSELKKRYPKWADLIKFCGKHGLLVPLVNHPNDDENWNAVCRYVLDGADSKPARFTAICRALDMPTPEEKRTMLLAAQVDAQRAANQKSLRRQFMELFLVPTTANIIGGLGLFLLLLLLGLKALL